MLGRKIGRHLLALLAPLTLSLRGCVTWGERHLGRPDDDAVLVDPYAERDVGDAEHVDERQGRVDERRMRRASGFIERPGGLDVGIEGDRDDGQPSGLKLSV